MKKTKIRQLSDEEKIITSRNIGMAKESLKEVDYEIRRVKMILEVGLDLNLAKMLTECKEIIDKASKGNSDWDKYLVLYNTLELNEGLKFKANRERKKYIQQLKDLEKDMQTIKFTIETAEKQIKDGVEVR